MSELNDGLVEIVNPNGLKGRVAPTSLAAQVYRPSPSQAAAALEAHEAVQEVVDPHTPINLLPPLEQPAKNASAEAWREYATDPKNPQALSADKAAEMGRDELVAHYTSEEN